MRRWIHRRKIMIFTLFLAVVIGCLSIALMYRINEISEESCFEQLHEAAQNLSQDIMQHITSDQNQLEVIAAILANYQDIEGEETIQILNEYKASDILSRLEILLPGDRVLLNNGEIVDASGVLSFEEEAAKGAHISDKTVDLLDSESYILRSFVPIERDGAVAGVLYGVIDLQTLPYQWKAEEFGGNASVYVIDGNTGDFIMDTWHKTLGNLIDLGSRRMKAGYTPEQFAEDIFAGETGYVVFVSRTIGDYLYLYYEPLEINEWRLAISVPESIVYEDAYHIRQVFYLFLALEFLFFLFYLIWILKYVRQETREKQKRLELISNVHDVEQLLFIAHHKSENIGLALEKAAEMTASQCAFFETVLDETQSQLYLWEKDPDTGEDSFLDIKDQSVFQDYFRENQKELVVFNEIEAYQAGKEIYSIFKQKKLKNLVVIPVENINKALIGALGIINTDMEWVDYEQLKSVTFSFSMFYHNMQSYTIARKMGEIDVLTGLLNRNRFERDISFYQQLQGKSLACIYLDANGLHELNNEKGHAAGDEMLKNIAGEIKREFGEETTYRIGGDEFLIFVTGKGQEEVLEMAARVQQAAGEKGYDVSVGVQWTEKVASVSRLMKEAERQMYADKERYYRERGKRR
ncbi:MAG TPA: sensor domain-containing diguanylate cyclase [Candidatus Acetatifactor stercoripullorum]|uniref:Sensor domain-containing diguanylate cyclase n=1 Tax=Candidatus Acetatifactor stercoripullorum TaxID=2838414 RepID=A0A9D1R5N2_9FIRM|nr:sensor domain-containing diguanylate cyclase [uncultured Acetatifactor sp.]HIW80963.1 sensor domain-containing diguanylate cyclase [Candidatus Acetatifactor stercoripullorum]